MDICVDYDPWTFVSSMIKRYREHQIMLLVVLMYTDVVYFENVKSGIHNSSRQNSVVVFFRR